MWSVLTSLVQPNESPERLQVDLRSLRCGEAACRPNTGEEVKAESTGRFFVGFVVGFFVDGYLNSRGEFEEPLVVDK